MGVYHASRKVSNGSSNLGIARLAVLEDRDEMQAAVPDEELANHLIASRYVFEAAEHMAKQKLIRLGTIDCAIEKARYDALDASLKESLNTNKGS